MLEDASLIELMGSIGEQDYFPGEPLLTVRDNGAFKVVEGNRRLAAVILLADPGRAPTRKNAVRLTAETSKHRPQRLPVLNFDARNEILDYLGYRHVTGIKEWDPLAKARYVRQLLERTTEQGEEVDLAQIARKIGSRRDYVERLLAGLRVHEHVADRNFYGLEGVDEEAIDFSVLTTALSYEAISSFVGLEYGGDVESELDDDHLQDLVDWSYRVRPTGATVLGESRNLRKLAEVVRTKPAVDALRAGATLEAAAELSGEAVVIFRDAIRGAQGNLATARDQVDRIGIPTPADAASVEDVVQLATLVQTSIGEKRRSNQTTGKQETTR
jgi:hypothetical protein